MKMAGWKGAHDDAFAVFEISIEGRGGVGEPIEVERGGGGYKSKTHQARDKYVII